MNYFHAVILAVIEGITEFLPISSTGHLILASKILNISQTEFVKSFEIIIQLGAILAVIFLYKNLLLQSKRIWSKIIIAFIPTGIIGLVFYKLIKGFLLGNEFITVLALFIGGIVLILIELILKKKNSGYKQIEQMSYKNAFLIGLIQSISVIPGVSRAASSIIGSRLLGLSLENSVLFSFLLAVPTIFMASLYDFTKSGLSFNTQEYLILAVGFITSFFVAFISIKFLLKYIRNHTFISFGVYRIILAVIYWLVIIR